MALRETIDYSVTGQWDGDFTASTRTSDGGKWLSATTSNGQIIVDAEENLTYSMRTGSVDVKYINNDTVECKTINVSQDPKTCECVSRGGKPTCSQSSITLPQTGTTSSVTITVTAACGSISSVYVIYQNEETPWATVTSGGTELNRTITISNVGPYSTANSSREFTIEVINTGVEDYCNAIITVTQPGPACNCDAISPFSQVVSSITTNGITAGTIMATYTYDSKCGNVSATIQKSNGAQTAMTCYNGDVILVDNIPATTSLSAITYTIRIFYDNVECTAFTATQEGLNCQCPTDLNTSAAYATRNIPRAGVGSEWFLVKTYTLPQNSTYSFDCLNAITLYPIIYPGQILSSSNTKVEAVYVTPAAGYTFKAINLYVRNVSENTGTSTRNSDCYLMMGNNNCATIRITQDGDGCGCGTYSPITKTLNKIPQSGVPANTVIATYRETSLSCSAIVATITSSGVTSNLTCNNGNISLPSAIGANTSSISVSHTVRIYYGDTSSSNLCTTFTYRQTHVVSCNCVSLSNRDPSTGDFFYVYGSFLPQTGCTSSQTPYMALQCGVNTNNVSEDCIDDIGFAMSPNETKSGEITWHFVNNGYSIVLYIDSLTPNNTLYMREFNFVLKMGDTICEDVFIRQESLVACDCDAFEENGLIKEINTTFSNSSHNNVLIASGTTNGCGSLRAAAQGCDFITISAQTVDDNYYWYANIDENSGNSRSCELYYYYLDWDGTEKECNKHSLIKQGPDYCDCPTIVSDSKTITIDGRERLGIYSPTDAVITGLTLNRYNNSSYLCQFVMAEVDENSMSWCSAYTRYYGSSYIVPSWRNVLQLGIEAKRNNTGQARSATITFIPINNPYRKSDGRIDVIKEVSYYSKSNFKNISYNICQGSYQITLIQQPDAVCGCNDFSFLSDSESALTTSHRGNKVKVSFSASTCVTIDNLTLKFIDDNGNEINQYNFINYYYFEKSGLRVYLYLIFKANDTGEDRTIKYKVIFEADNDTCELQGEIIQESCSCSELINSCEREIVNYDETTASVVIGDDDCGVLTSSYSITMTDMQGNPTSYDWITPHGFNYGWYSINAKFDLSANTTSSDRVAYFKVTIESKCESECLFSILQKTRNICNTFKECVLNNKGNSEFFSYNETGSSNTRRIAQIDTSCAPEVRKLSYELVNLGYNTDWINVQLLSQTAITCYLTSENNGGSQRRVGINVKYLDSNGNQINDCETEVTIVQYSSSPSECNCYSVSDDDAHLEIYNGTKNQQGRYEIEIAKGVTTEIGKITWSNGRLPDCLSYTATNSQQNCVEVRINEEAGSNNTRIFKIIAETKAGCGEVSASSTLIRTNNGQECNTPSWDSRYLIFLFPTT